MILEENNEDTPTPQLFTQDEVVDLVTVCSFYDPLLVEATNIMRDIVDLVAHGKKVDYNTVYQCKKWIEDYYAMAARIKVFNEKQTMQ